MGSHVTCFLRKSDHKTNVDLQPCASSGKRYQQSADERDGQVIANHQHILWRHHDVLKRTLDSKGFLLLELLSRDVLEDRDRQWIKAEKKDAEMNARLINWLMENDAHTYAVFLDSLRASHQQHIANLLEGREGERVLTDEELQHITKLEPLLAILLDAKVGLVDMLYSCGAICKTDYQRIFVRQTDYQINKKLLKVLLRCSDVSWHFFFEGLKETKQSHLLKYFDHGEVISAKVEMLPQSCRHFVRERAIIDHVNDVTRHLHSTPVSHYIEDDRLVSELARISVECVCIHIDSHVAFYFYCPSVSSLSQLWRLHRSGQLQGLIGDLFNVRSMEAQHFQFRVTVSKSDYKTCKRLLDSSDSSSVIGLLSASSTNQSKTTQIQHLPSCVLHLILLKAAASAVTMDTARASRISSSSAAEAFVLLSSVSSSWKNVVSDRDFSRLLRLHLAPAAESLMS